MDNNQSFSHKEQVKDILFKRPTYIDPLTGLFNRLYLYQFLPEEIKKAKLSNYLLAFLMIDLDGFKHVNDTY
ncbi:MAG: diguanylate cyclase, partial [Candidatus Omnitrophota bacterium]